MYGNGYGTGGVTACPDAKVNATSPRKTDEACEKLEALRTRIDRATTVLGSISDRLLGPHPETAQRDGDRPCAAGFVARLEYAVESAHEQMNRLETIVAVLNGAI